MGYYDNSKAYKIWVPRTHTVMKSRDVIFDESNLIERVTIHSTDEDDLPNLWTTETPMQVTTIETPSTPSNAQSMEGDELPFASMDAMSAGDRDDKEMEQTDELEQMDGQRDGNGSTYAPHDFERGEWLDPMNTSYGKGKQNLKAMYLGIIVIEESCCRHKHEHAYVSLADNKLANYREAMTFKNANEWKEACKTEYEMLESYGTWTLVTRPLNVNVIGNQWVFRVKRDNLRNINKLKARLVAQGFSQIPGIDFTETYSPTIRFTSIRFILALALQHDLELQQIDVKGAYLNRRLDETIYMCQPDLSPKGRRNLCANSIRGSMA